jgi:hypothetical protein
MSRKIDMNDLSDADLLYLQNRGKRPEGVAPIPTANTPRRDLGSVTNTGDMGLPSAQSEAVFTGQAEAPRFQIDDNYDELNVSDLKDEIAARNEAIDRANEDIEDEEDQIAELSTKGRKEVLIARLRADDQRLAAAGELEGTE